MTVGTTCKFFVYGTLLEGDPDSASEFLFAHSIADHGCAFVSGHLYLINHPNGVYPALILGDGGRVWGKVLEVSSASLDKVLTFLDQYEETGPGFAKPCEYDRCILEVTNRVRSETHRAWVYLYNWDLPETAVPIPGGKFLDFLKTHDKL